MKVQNYNNQANSQPFGMLKITRNTQDLAFPHYDNLAEKRGLKQLVEILQKDIDFKTVMKNAPDDVELRFFADEASGDIFQAKIGKNNVFEKENTVEICPLYDRNDPDRNIVKTKLINIIKKVSGL